MAIRIVCPGCQTLYALADHLAGKTVRCKKCNDTFTLPSLDAPDKIQTQPQATRRPLARDQDEEESPRLRRRWRDDDDDSPRIRRSTNGLLIALIAGGAGLVLLLAGGILVVVLVVANQTASPPPDMGFNAHDAWPPGPADRLPDNADAVTRALHQLKSTNVHQRHEALRKLKDTLPDERRAEVVKALEPMLNDPDIFTRKWAVEAIGVWANKDAVPILLKAMRDGDTRHEAMKALGRLKDERAIEPIAQRLEEHSDLHEAGEALKSMGPIAEKAVLARLNHHDWFVRIMVCQILERIGTAQSIPALERAEVNDFSIKIQSRNAINAIKARQ
jgi:predicted Zn finger-like uncharacterized protein